MEERNNHCQPQGKAGGSSGVVWSLLMEAALPSARGYSPGLTPPCRRVPLEGSGIGHTKEGRAVERAGRVRGTKSTDLWEARHHSCCCSWNSVLNIGINCSKSLCEEQGKSHVVTGKNILILELIMWQIYLCTDFTCFKIKMWRKRIKTVSTICQLHKEASRFCAVVVPRSLAAKDRIKV